MRKVIIASAVRTPIGDFGGSLKAVKPVNLIITVMKECLRRAKLEKEAVDQVIMGSCFAPIDQNLARLALLLMNMPYKIPGHYQRGQCDCPGPS